MKKILFLLPFLPLFAGAQIFYPFGHAIESTTFTFSNEDSLTHHLVGTFDGGSFEGNTPSISIDTSSATLWQIGNSLKPIFSNDSVAVRGIMTDTLIPYPANANDFFMLKIDSVVPNFIVDVWHKYETDSLHAGGIVEYSFDTVTWINVANCPYLYTQNIYSLTDTIISGQPAFTGNSNGEQLSRIQFFNCEIFGYRQTSTFCTMIAPLSSIYLRFRFVSDSTIDSLSGWIIDSIRIENPGCKILPGFVSEFNDSSTLNIDPNPAIEKLTVTSTVKINNVAIFNLLGQAVFSRNYNDTGEVQIDISTLPTGMYFMKVNGSEVRKFVKE